VKRREAMRLVLLLLAVVWTARGAIFPSVLEAQYAIESKFTVTLDVGTPPRPLRLVVDLASTGVTTKIPLPMVSRSYSPAMGGSDVVHFANRNFRVPVTVDGTNAKAVALMCADCEGSIGIGPGSKLWLYFHDAIFTPGSFSLEEGLIAYGSQAAGLGWFDCLPATPNVCTVFAGASPGGVSAATGFGTDPLVGRVRLDGLAVVFGVSTPVTIVPQALYQAFTQGRDVQHNSDPADWPDLDIRIPATAGGGRANHVKLRAEDVVTRSRRTGHDLLLEPGPVGSTTIVLSISAWRSMMLRRRFDTGEAQAISWCARKHWSTYALVLMYIAPVLFVFWKLSPAGAWKAPSQATTWGPAWKILASGLAALLALMTYALPTTQDALKGHLDVNIFMGCMIANLALWQVFAAVAYLTGGAGRILGYYAVYPARPPRAPPPADHGAGASSTPAGLWLPKPQIAPIPEPAANRLPLPLVYLTPRLWILMSTVNETQILAVGWLLMIQRRAESLGAFFILFMALFVIFNLVYHSITAFFVTSCNDGVRAYKGSVADNVGAGARNGYGLPHVRDASFPGTELAARGGTGVYARSVRWSFVWALFWACIVAILVAALAVTEIHIMQPFMERHDLRFPRALPYLSVFLYTAGLIIAIRWARHRVLYEETTKFRMIQLYQKRKQ